jgi:hypothetical protein
MVCNLPEFLCYLRDKAEIVRDNYYAAFEVFYGPGEGINRCHIQVIGGLI